MALTQAQASMVLGNRDNTRQMIFGIPAGLAEQPGMLCLESVDAAGTTFSKLYLWADSDGALRYHTGIPTDENSDGSVLATSASTGGNRYLSNLLATAVNTSLISDTTATDDLGSSSIYWRYGYIGRVYLNATAYIDGTSAGVVLVEGTTQFGATGGALGEDVCFYGNTNTYDALWDTSADGLLFKDNAKILIGTSSDVSITWNATTLEVDFAAANSVVNFGATGGNDLVLHGVTATYDWHWDASANTLGALDNAKLGFGNTAAAPDFWVTWDATDAELDFVADDKVFNFGNTHPSDLVLHGDLYDIYWDGSADTLIAKDNCKVAFGTDSDMFILGNNTTIEIDFAAANYLVNFGATGGNDLVLHGADAGYDVMWDASKDSLSVLDAAKLGFGTGAAGVTDIVISYTGGTNILNIGQGAAGTGAITFGADGKGIDVKFFGETASYFWLFDQDGGTNGGLVCTDGTVTYTFAEGSSNLILTATDNASAKLTIGATGTNGVDFQLTGATSGDDVVFNSGTSTLTYQGIFKHATRKAATKTTGTLGITDVGTLLTVTADAQTLTLPATVVGYTYVIMNGTTGQLLTISPNANDKIMGAGFTAADDKDITNTALTAKKGDFVVLFGDGVDGWYIQEMAGTWAYQG